MIIPEKTFSAKYRLLFFSGVVFNNSKLSHEAVREFAKEEIWSSDTVFKALTDLSLSRESIG